MKRIAVVTMIRSSLAVLGIVAANLFVGNALAQSFTATFDFASVTTTSGTTDPTPPPTATGLTFGSFGSAGYTGNSSAAGRFSLAGNPTGSTTGNDNFATFTGNLDPTRYYQVILTPQPNYVIDLNSIAFTIQRSGTGIRSYAVRSSVDNFTANLPASISPANVNLTVGPSDEFRWVFDAQNGANNGSLVSLGAAFDAVSAPVTFRFYSWNAEAATGTFSVDNVAFSGVAISVPEPTSVSLVAIGLLGLLIRRRK